MITWGPQGATSAVKDGCGVLTSCESSLVVSLMVIMLKHAHNHTHTRVHKVGIGYRHWKNDAVSEKLLSISNIRPPRHLEKNNHPEHHAYVMIRRWRSICTQPERSTLVWRHVFKVGLWCFTTRFCDGGVVVALYSNSHINKSDCTRDSLCTVYCKSGYIVEVVDKIW